MKSYTDLEQSHKLAEILSLDSADMSWVSCDDGRQKYYQAENRKIILMYEKKHWIPCWSLAALLNVLPQGTRLLKSAIDETYHCDCPKGNVNEWFDNSVDACYEIILKLHELNLL